MDEEMTDEEFFTTQIAKVGNYGDTDADFTARLFANYSDEIERMSKELQNFYENFGKKTNYVLIGLYIPVIPVAIIANILVIVVVFKNHYMRSTTNYFVVNLSVADLLVTTICMPIAISQAVSITWLYGEIMCKLFFYLQGVAVAASVFTIMVMSIDRYLAIKNPIVFRRVFNRKRMSIVIVAIWLVSFSIFSPLLKAVTVHRLDQYNFTLGMPASGDLNSIKIFRPPPIAVCSEDFKSLGINAHIFGTACFVLVYAIPGTVVLVVYLMMGRTLYTRKPPFDTDSIKGSTSLQQGFRLVRERKRIAWILLILAILFALCWLPYNVLRLLIDLGIISGEWVGDALSYYLFLGHANSMLNPVVYCFMTRTFRRSISEILCQRSCDITKRKPHRNTLAVAARACSSRITQNRTCLDQGTSLPGDTDRMRINPRLAQDRSATMSTAFDSLSSKHSPHRRCYKYANQTNQKYRHQESKLAEVSKHLRGSLNDMAIMRDECHTKIRSKSLDNVATFNVRSNQTR